MTQFLSRPINIRSVVWAAILAFVLIPGAVLADEAWKTDAGTVEWEKNVGDTAVFKLPTPGKTGSHMRLFIEYLAPDTSGERGTYTGYWTDDSADELCEASLTDALGNSSHNWGRLQISFAADGDNYWEWTARYGECFRPARDKLVAVPIKGGGNQSVETDPVRKMAIEFGKAFKMRAMDNLDKKGYQQGEIEFAVEHSLGDEDVESQKFFNFEAIEMDLLRNEFEPGFPNREVDPLVECKAGTCKYDVKGLLHNTLFLSRITYGMKDGKPFIKGIYVINGD